MIPVYIQPGVQLFPDGREVCDLKKASGKLEYASRTGRMVFRQRGICCLLGHCPTCPGRLSGDAEFEHEDGKGSGGAHRDDRIEVDGKWKNGAAHHHCNMWKSSRRIDYNTALQARQERGL